MDQTRSTAVGALILSIGVAAAMLFRTETSTPTEAELPPSAGGRFAIAVARDNSNAARGDVLLRDRAQTTAALTQIPAQPGLDPHAKTDSKPEVGIPSSRFGSNTPSPHSVQLQPIPKVESRRLTDPPRMPSQYGALLRDGGSASTRGPVARQDRDNGTAMLPRRTERRRRSHTIRNGDTLESIAQRYYRDASLADALYEVNRERLPSRQLLPLNTELTLPDASQLRTSAETSEAPSSAASPNRLPQMPQPKTTLGSVR